LLYSATGLPGNKFYAGMSYGLAETTSSLISGPVLKHYRDNNVISVFVTMGAVSLLGFYFICDGGNTSLFAIALSFIQVLGTAFGYNSLFLMIEFRAPP
jgi:hypothetical protein